MVASRFGDGSWDRNLYFHVNYGTSGTGWQSLGWLTSWASANGVAVATISRYNVYRAEVAAIGAGTLQMHGSDGTTELKRRFTETISQGQGQGQGSQVSYYSYANGRCAPSQAASNTIKDRRVLTAAVVNCLAGNVQGSVHIDPIGWIDTFLVEPSVDRGTYTGKDQIYVEIIGGATKPNGEGPFQYFLKQRPRLIR